MVVVRGVGGDANKLCRTSHSVVVFPASKGNRGVEGLEVLSELEKAQLKVAVHTSSSLS